MITIYIFKNTILIVQFCCIGCCTDITQLLVQCLPYRSTSSQCHISGSWTTVQQGPNAKLVLALPNIHGNTDTAYYPWSYVFIAARDHHDITMTSSLRHLCDIGMKLAYHPRTNKVKFCHPVTFLCHWCHVQRARHFMSWAPTLAIIEMLNKGCRASE